MKDQESNLDNGISRKQAMDKMGKFGKYAALTALGTYILLSPKQAQAQSPEDPDIPGVGF